MRALLLLLMLTCSSLQASEPKPFSKGSMAQILQQGAGKPLIISFWSLDCPACFKELPVWRQLATQYKDIGLTLVATDNQAYQDEVIAVLNEFKLSQLDNWQFAASEKALRYDIDPRWMGELPRSYLITPQGEIKGISGVIALEQLRSWLSIQQRQTP